MSSKLIKLPAVERKTSLKKSAIYSRIKQGTFPQPVRIGARCVAWVEGEVDAWIDTLPRGTAESTAQLSEDLK